MKLSSKRAEEAHEIDGKPFTLRELNAGDCSVFVLEHSARRASPGTFKDKPSLDAVLLGLALFDENGVTVKAEAVDKWSNTTVEALAKRALEMSGLSKEAAKAAGNG